MQRKHNHHSRRPKEVATDFNRSVGTMKKKTIVLLSTTVLHFGLTVSLFLAEFSAGMNRFEAGTTSTAGDSLLHFVAITLMWPIFYPMVNWGGQFASKFFPGILGYVPMLLNSLIWGFMSLWFFNLMTGQKSNTEHKATIDAAAPPE